MDVKLAGLVILAVGVIVSSCQKEISFSNESNTGGNSNSSLAGDWKFVGMNGSVETVISATQAGMEMKAVAFASYIAKNCTGTVTFTATEFNYSNLAYDVDTTINLKVYVGGLLLSNTDEPFAFNSPPTTNSADYVRNNSDSITLSNLPIDPNIPTMPGGGPVPVLPSGPFGARILWMGDTLSLKVSNSFSTTVTQNGVPARFDAGFSSMIKLVRL
jgi:hypothetical protein